MQTSNCRIQCRGRVSWRIIEFISYIITGLVYTNTVIGCALTGEQSYSGIRSGTAIEQETQSSTNQGYV